ncbi:MAG: response regulator [Lachnospiraceae bacterium]|nr:response regulator [Lachnospiraceae bacterium]
MIRKRLASATALVFLIVFLVPGLYLIPAGATLPSEIVHYVNRHATKVLTGGGYAASGQIDGVGYTTVLYDGTNGLTTSDTMFLLCDTKGYMWIGGYSGVMRYDGSTFEKLDSSDGLTSARGFFEDSKGRIWIATNDNGVVVIDGETRRQYSYKDGLSSSSVRIFTEDRHGNIFIGTTAGVAYVTPNGVLQNITDGRIGRERVLKLETDSTGRIYGQTSSGLVFTIDDCRIGEIYSSGDLGIGKITAIMADPEKPGEVYLGSSWNMVYHGRFGLRAENMEAIPVDPLVGVHWLSYDCGRVWVSSTSSMGYIDEEGQFHELEESVLDSGIEMTTSDYQGNIWAASSTQGVMKVVTNSFVDLTAGKGFEETTTNAVCIHNNIFYVGTDNGLRALDQNGGAVSDRLTDAVGGSRIRCIMEDSRGYMWVSTYTGGKGLVRVTPNGYIKEFTMKNGMPSNEIRATIESRDGSILAGTNGGVAVIRDGIVIRTVGADKGMRNTAILTVEEGPDGTIYAGSDGDGIYVIEGDRVSRLGRNEGLTSDVVMRIKWDEQREVFWIVTSNSIEYLKNGVLTTVTSFPYNNNYDLYFNREGEMWILSSYGIYHVSADEMLTDRVENYRLYTIANGLPYSLTSNAYSASDRDGNLYMAGRKGVIRVNIDNFFEGNAEIKTALNSIYCDGEKILPDTEGVYRIPASRGRIRITPAVLDYTNTNPPVRIFLEGRDESVTAVAREKLSPVEYTDLPYGNYTFRIQVLSADGLEVLSDNAFLIVKKARVGELVAVRIVMIALIAAVTGWIVWRFLKSTIINRQYEAISQAKDEADRANAAKSRFLANMSHEIRTPINTIMGMNEMALREDATGVPKTYFMSMMNYSLDIRNASESLLGLINDLLDMSKIESGKMNLVEQEYDVQDMLRSVVSMIRSRSTQKELTFDVVVDEILPGRLYGDEGKIRQILLNLLTNAVKYTRHGGLCLDVSMTERSDDMCMLRFSVKDTGIGVKPEDKDKLFEAYERLDEESNSGIQGTGLGLDISKKFADLMNGSLTCESVYGEGSEFILSIGQRIVDAAPVGVFTERDANEAKGPYVPQFVAPDADILVVDDTPMNLNIIKGLLKATKVFVTTASSGEECLELLENSSFNVVLLDHMMPGMDGVETLAKIREKYKDLPVYALTANASAGEAFYRSKGFNGYLSKPVDSRALEKAIMSHLPEEIIQKPSLEAQSEELTELPENLLWIRETEGIDADAGIANSGGITNYIFALKLFLETIDDNARVLTNALDGSNIRLYTIKVHALKSSARIIGAAALSRLAEELENAGNNGDMLFISEHADELIRDYLAYKDKLAGLEEAEEQEGQTEESGSREPIPEAMLKDAYSALKEMIPQMDYDAVEVILDQLAEYRLPPEDEGIMKELRHKLKLFDWDGMEALAEQKD